MGTRSQIEKLATEAQYKRALATVARLMKADPPAESKDGEKLGRLASLIEAYEREHFPGTFESAPSCMEELYALGESLIELGLAMQRKDVTLSELSDAALACGFQLTIAIQFPEAEQPEETDEGESA